MNNKVGAFCALVDFLYREHARWSRSRDVNERQRRLNREVGKRVKVVEEAVLKGLLQRAKAGEAVQLGQKDGLIFLQPPDKESALLPILGFNANLAAGMLRVRLALFTFEEPSSEVVAVGFRFETPEGEGRHNYHHSQLTRFLEKDSAPLPGMPAWFPESQPALMIAARTPYALFLAVLIGLYGLDTIEKKWSAHSIGQHLEEDRSQLRNGCGVPPC